ncbi:MAG: Ig-like domain-containing protein [Lachnospiraceae bacterium]|nr:Ig-like domain-containing protein [Lachnospiraceae bacterium]MCR5769325.1 Ig-like domain-containing protein [Lachnospiraceae bacterium]
MTKMSFFRYAGFILFFGLCIILLSGNVNASAAENDFKLNVSDVSIIKDGSYRLKVYNLGPEQSVIYRSGNSAVAMVSRTGKVTGLSFGETVITATVIEEGAAIAALQCNVTIGPAAVSIKLTKANLVLKEGKKQLLTTVVYPMNTVESPMFYSKDPEIAKVSSVGRIRAVAAGSTQVYALLENQQYAVCNVTVLNEEDYEKYRSGMSVEEILAENGDETEDEQQDPDESNTDEDSSNGDPSSAVNDNTETKAVDQVTENNTAVNE